MRIAIDATPLSVRRSGIGNYIRGAVDGLERVGCEVVPFALGSPDALLAVREALADHEVSTIELPAANVVRRGWSMAGRPALERLVGPVDATLLSDWWYPPQKDGARATVVHDLVPFHFPQWVTRRTLAGHRLGYRALLPTCDVIFAVSDYTANDLATTLGIDPCLVAVASPGVDERFRPDGPKADLGRPYVLAVATLEPRKNIDILLAARRLLPPEMDIAIVGGEGWGGSTAADSPGVLRLGYVADDDLPELFRGAHALVFPSFFEGFGMPVIEAMACGCPTVVSSHPSLDEAAGEAAVRFDPRDAPGLVAAVGRVTAQRDDMRALGLVHAARFTWARAGEAMRGAYERVLSSR